MKDIANTTVTSNFATVDQVVQQNVLTTRREQIAYRIGQPTTNKELDNLSASPN